MHLSNVLVKLYLMRDLGRRPRLPFSHSTEESETAIRYNFPIAQPPFAGIPPGFQPYPVDQPKPPMPQPCHYCNPPSLCNQQLVWFLGKFLLFHHPGPQPSPIPDDQPPFIPPSRAGTGTHCQSTPIPVPYPSMSASQTTDDCPYSPSNSRDSSMESTRRSG